MRPPPSTILVIAIIAVAATEMTGLLTAAEFGAPIGMNATIEEIILPGSELQVKPIQDDQPIVLRITKAFRHGSSFRYHLVYYGLEPGSYDLSEYLQRKDGSAVGELPAIDVKIHGVLPPGQVKPNALSASKSPMIGGYRLLLGLGAVVWLIGLFLLLRANAKPASDRQGRFDQQPATLADRLRPLVESAANGSLDDTQRADLERLLFVYWRKKLGVQDLPPAAAMAALKADPEAGKLMRQLEIWLHHPAPDPSIDLAALLEPYRSIAANDMVSSTSGPNTAP